MTTSRRTFALSALLAPTLAVQAAETPSLVTDPAAKPCELASAGTITWEEIRARYANPDSKFVVLEGADGIEVHYKDEGKGPAVLLVHSSSGDLKDWDGWVKILAPRYRVVRLDLPAFGLTGPVPSGNYSVDRYLTLVDALMDHLGIESFAIVGASYGGLVAFRYAATRIERVTALVLSDSAGIEYGGRGGTSARARARTTVFTPEHRTEEKTETMLKSMINDPSRVTPELVRRKTDYANVVGRDREAFVATALYERGNPQRVLAHVRAPALVLWGGASRGLSPETATAFADAMKNARSVNKILYPGGGHFLHIERPDPTGQDAAAFLDREVARG